MRTMLLVEFDDERSASLPDARVSAQRTTMAWILSASALGKESSTESSAYGFRKADE
jgi:hypothetical protein